MSHTVVVVSGLPRSGTSLMMRVLEGAGLPVLRDDVRTADESNPHGYFEYAAVRRTATDARWVDDAQGRAVKVIHTLLEHLPRDRSYRVILMRRPIEEVVASQNRMLTRFGADRGALPDARVGQVLTEQLREATDLLDREPCFTWIGVDYPRLIAEPAQTICEVIGFLGLSAPIGDLARLVDPALHRERLR